MNNLRKAMTTICPAIYGGWRGMAFGLTSVASHMKRAAAEESRSL